VSGIVIIQGSDIIRNSRAVINDNFAFLSALVGSGLRGTGTLTFSLIPDGRVGVQTFTLTGAAAGSPVVLGCPSTLEAGLIASARVSALNTIEVRIANLTGADMTPASAQTFKVAVL
jgi:hypothetical protein